MIALGFYAAIAVLVVIRALCEEEEERTVTGVVDNALIASVWPLYIVTYAVVMFDKRMSKRKDRRKLLHAAMRSPAFIAKKHKPFVN